MAQVAVDSFDWTNFAVVIAGIGYAVGQFFSSRRKGVSDSLKTALDEVEVGRIKAERLAGVATEKSTELAEEKLENQTLRSVLVGGGAVSPEILKRLDELLTKTRQIVHEEHEKTRAAIRESRQ